MKKYNMKSIMKKAWELVKKFQYTMSHALKIAWANAKTIAKAIADNLITEVAHTHSGWNEYGREVMHGQHAMFKVVVIDPRTKSGTRCLPYFCESQTCPLGSQD